MGWALIVAIAALMVAIAGVLVTLYVPCIAREASHRAELILAVIFKGLMELGLKEEAIGRVIEPLTQTGYVSIMTEAGGHAHLQVSKKGRGILGTVGNLKNMPRIPIDIKWD